MEVLPNPVQLTEPLATVVLLLSTIDRLIIMSTPVRSQYVVRWAVKLSPSSMRFIPVTPMTVMLTLVPQPVLLLERAPVSKSGPSQWSVERSSPGMVFNDAAIDWATNKVTRIHKRALFM